MDCFNSVYKFGAISLSSFSAKAVLSIFGVLKSPKFCNHYECKRRNNFTHKIQWKSDRYSYDGIQASFHRRNKKRIHFQSLSVGLDELRTVRTQSYYVSSFSLVETFTVNFLYAFPLKLNKFAALKTLSKCQAYLRVVTAARAHIINAIQHIIL